LLNSAYKIYSEIITSRLNAITEVLLQEQHGFQTGRSCADCNFTVRQLIQKRREFNLEMHLLFVDYVKAFDRILLRKLWDVMTAKNIRITRVE
jgi:hypothetical protein